MNTPPSSQYSWLRWLGIGLLGLLLAGAGIGYYLYQQIFGTNVTLEQPAIIDISASIHTPKELGVLLKDNNIIADASSFTFTAQQMQFTPKAGRFEIPTETQNNRQLVRVLRGKPMTVRLTFHNFRKKEQLAGHVGRVLELDSLDLIQLFQDDAFLAKEGYTTENVLTAFVPNTYELYWNTSAQDFWERMKKEHKKFWTQARLDKAANLNLSPKEVYILASIVETESQYKPERPRIAGVYLNRLKTKGWTLSADPTVIYAHNDFSIKRVLNHHLELDSPYNTYKYPGLPPGPIYMASINAIDAVLDAEEHDYWFFCAKPPQAAGAPQTHAFAKTHRAHINNAKKYHQWVRTQD